jgi:ribonuclease HI
MAGCGIILIAKHIIQGVYSDKSVSWERRLSYGLGNSDKYMSELRSAAMALMAVSAASADVVNLYIAEDAVIDMLSKKPKPKFKLGGPEYANNPTIKYATHALELRRWDGYFASLFIHKITDSHELMASASALASTAAADQKNTDTGTNANSI